MPMSVARILSVGLLTSLLAVSACDQDGSGAAMSDAANLPEEAVVVDKPANAVEAFYTAAVSNDCNAAAMLRPGFTQERCEKLTKATIHSVESLLQEDRFAMVALSISLVSGGKAQDFNGVVHMEEQEGHWTLLKFEEDPALIHSDAQLEAAASSPVSRQESPGTAQQ